MSVEQCGVFGVNVGAGAYSQQHYGQHGLKLEETKLDVIGSVLFTHWIAPLTMIALWVLDVVYI